MYCPIMKEPKRRGVKKFRRFGVKIKSNKSREALVYFILAKAMKVQPRRFSS